MVMTPFYDPLESFQELVSYRGGFDLSVSSSSGEVVFQLRHFWGKWAAVEELLLLCLIYICGSWWQKKNEEVRRWYILRYNSIEFLQRRANIVIMTYFKVTCLSKIEIFYFNIYNMNSQCYSIVYASHIHLMILSLSKEKKCFYICIH